MIQIWLLVELELNLKCDSKVFQKKNWRIPNAKGGSVCRNREDCHDILCPLLSFKLSIRNKNTGKRQSSRQWRFIWLIIEKVSSCQWCSLHKVVGIIVVVLKLTGLWLTWTWLQLGGHTLSVIHLVHSHVGVVHIAATAAHIHLASWSPLHLVFLIHCFHHYKVAPINWPCPSN